MSFTKIWFFSHCDINTAIRVAKCADDNSFDFFLMPFKVRWADPISKCVMVLSQTKRIKAIAALPGYVATPAYIAMVNTAMKEMFPDRKFYLNIIDGGIFEDPSEFGLEKDSDRKQINENFVKDLLERETPGIMFSGKSDNTYEKAMKYGDLQLALYEDAHKIPEDRYSTLALRIFICVKDTDEEAEKFLKETLQRYRDDENFANHLADRIERNILCGSPETIVEKIEKLKAEGFAGILVSDLIGTNTEEDVIKLLANV